jgi:hypothetical protein
LTVNRVTGDAHIRNETTRAPASPPHQPLVNRHRHDTLKLITRPVAEIKYVVGQRIRR